MSCIAELLNIRIFQNVLSLSDRLFSTFQKGRLHNCSTCIHFFSTWFPDLRIFTNGNVLEHLLKLRIFQKWLELKKLQTAQISNYIAIYNQICTSSSRCISCFTIEHLTDIAFYHISEIVEFLIYGCYNRNEFTFTGKIYSVRTRFVGIFNTSKVVWIARFELAPAITACSGSQNQRGWPDSSIPRYKVSIFLTMLYQLSY